MIDNYRNSWLRKAFAVAVIIGVLLLIPTWVMDFHYEYIMDRTPAIVHSITVKNKDKKVCQGGMLLYEVDITKLRDLEPTLKRQIVNSYMITYAPEHPPRKPLERKTHPGKLYIPKNAEVSDWYMRWTAEYEEPPRKRNGSPLVIPVSKTSDTFWVVECD